MKTQWEKRVDVTILIYQWLLLEFSNEELFKIAFEQENFDADQMKIIEYLVVHKNDIVNLITPLLEKSWKWERLNFFDRAIMLEAYAEVEVLNTNKAIIIDQALITAKKYNIDDSYKYINPILDKVIK